MFPSSLGISDLDVETSKYISKHQFRHSWEGKMCRDNHLLSYIKVINMFVGCPRHVASIISGNVLGSIYIKPKTRQILAYRMSGMNSNGLENCLINLTIAYMCFIKILCCYFSCLLFFLIILSFFHTFLRIKY